MGTIWINVHVSYDSARDVATTLGLFGVPLALLHNEAAVVMHHDRKSVSSQRIIVVNDRLVGTHLSA